MQKRKENVFLSPKFKKLYVGLSCGLTMLITMILFIMMLAGNNVAQSNGSVFTYCTALMLIIVVVGMIIDESIRKYPGLIITFCTSIYTFSYILICFMKGGASTVGYVMLAGYALFIGISYLIYSKFYPILVVGEKYVKLFNTLYLIIVLMVTIVIGFMYSL